MAKDGLQVYNLTQSVPQKQELNLVIFPEGKSLLYRQGVEIENGQLSLDIIPKMKRYFCIKDTS